MDGPAAYAIDYPVTPLFRYPQGFASSCFVGTLATDFAYWRTADFIWADFSDWLVSVGVVIGFIAIVVALVERFAVRRPWPWRTSTAATIVWLIGWVVAVIDMMVHTRDSWTSVVPWGIVLSALVVVILFVSALAARARPAVAAAEVVP